MAWTEIEVANIALARIGVSDTLTSTDGTVAAIEQTNDNSRMVQRFYAKTRELLIQRFPWSRQQKFGTLVKASDGTDEDWDDRWVSAYTYPADCLCFRDFVDSRIAPSIGLPGGDHLTEWQPLRIRWSLGLHDDALVIFADTDETSPKVCYIASGTDLDVLGGSFDSALAWSLALELGLVLKVGTEKVERARRFAQLELLQARASAANEEDDPAQQDGSFVRSRAG